MRKLVSHLIMTLDGVVHFDAVADAVRKRRNQEVMDDFNACLAQEDAMLLGRVTYQEWSAYWPGSDYQPFAGHINGVPKFVVSRTLTEAHWPGANNASLLRGDVAAAITELKARPGGNIGVHGSPRLAEWLLHAGLLDELRLELYPVVAGRGARLVQEGRPGKTLHLAGTKATSKGVVILTYRPVNRG
jgi:dihydrofolate reductase